MAGSTEAGTVSTVGATGDVADIVIVATTMFVGERTS